MRPKMLVTAEGAPHFWRKYDHRVPSLIMGVPAPPPVFFFLFSQLVSWLFSQVFSSSATPNTANLLVLKQNGMSHQQAKSGGKPQSPEKRYNAGKKRDEEIRVMKVANKQSDQYLSVATWETNLGIKDVTANKRWQDESARADAFLTNTKIKQVRHAKLTELYAQDEAMYERELNERGLAFCREKY